MSYSECYSPDILVIHCHKPRREEGEGGGEGYGERQQIKGSWNLLPNAIAEHNVLLEENFWHSNGHKIFRAKPIRHKVQKVLCGCSS